MKLQPHLPPQSRSTRSPRPPALRAAAQRPARLARRALAALCASLAALALAAPAAFASEVHAFIPPAIGSAGTGDGQFELLAPILPTNGGKNSAGSGIAVDNSTGPSEGDFYVTDTLNHRVEKFNEAGQFLLAFGADVGGPGVDTCTSGCGVGTAGSAPGQLESPTFVALDSSAGESRGDVYVFDSGDGLVSKFNEDGELITAWGNNGAGGAANGQLVGDGAETFASHGGIAAIGVNTAGTFYVITHGAGVTDHNEGEPLYEFEPDAAGSFSQFHRTAQGAAPVGIGFESDGYMYRSLTTLLEKFSPSGAQVNHLNNEPLTSAYYTDEPEAITGLTLDPSTNDLYLDYPGGVSRYDSQSVLQEPAFGATHLTAASSIAVRTSNHRLYVLDPGSSAVKVFDSFPRPTTAAATELTRTTATALGSLEPEGLAVEECAFQYVTETAYDEHVKADNGNEEEEGFSDLTSGGTAPCEHPAAAEIPAAVNEPVEVHAGLELKAGTNYRFRLLDKNAKHGTIYASAQSLQTPPAVTGLKTEEPTDVTNDSATFNGSFAGEAGLQTEYYFEYGTTKQYGYKTPLATIPGPLSGTEEHPSTHLEGLAPDTTYYYRIVAENSYGITPSATAPPSNEESFTTYVGPSIEGISTSHLTATSADLEAIVNPHGLPAGVEAECHFEYGPTTAYGTTVPCPEKLSGTTPKAVKVEITGLQRSVTYHFRLIAENKWESATSEDHSFEFFPPACPNAAVRQQTGSAYLPDCRAYELVSPANANATLLSPAGPNTGQATSPSRFSFSGNFSSLPGTNTIVTDGDLYVATRTDTGWVSKYIGLPGNEAGCMGGPPTGPTVGQAAGQPEYFADSVLTDPSMSRFADFIDGGPIECFGGEVFGEGSYKLATPSNAPYLWNSEGTLERRLPTDLAALPGALAAFQCPYFGGYSEERGNCSGETTASPDLGHLFFSSNRLSFSEPGEPPGLTTSPGSAYDDNLATGKVTLISNLPAAVGGGPIPQPDSFPSEDREEHVGTPGSAEQYLRFPAVSTDGSHVLISTATAGTTIFEPCPEQGTQKGECKHYTETPIRLYMHVDEEAAPHGETYEVAEEPATHLPAPVTYVGMTPDGSKVFFTSEAHLTGEDEDHSGASLYMWEAKKAEAGVQPLTLISKGEQEVPGQPGDTAACDPQLAKKPEIEQEKIVGEEEVPWTTGCGVVPYSGFSWAQQEHAAGGNGISDSAIAQNGDIYFYSPEQLEGTKGVPGQENLYDYREGRARYVTTFAPEVRCAGPRGCESSGGPLLRIEISPDDSHMAFLTASRITSYDNTDPQGNCEYEFFGHPNGETHCAELYSYTPATGQILCDSCNPDGRPPTSGVEASQDGLFMTEDGRVFFSTAESLVPSDTNGAEDVYEYVDGRPQLITPGTGTATSTGSGSVAHPGLASVSANGTDVYFSTYNTLTSEDHNGNFLKFYDARTNGGFPQPPPVQPCAAAEECHGPGTEAPTLPTQGTAANLTGGNATSEHHAKHHKKKHHRKAAAKKSTAKHHRRGGASKRSKSDSSAPRAKTKHLQRRASANRGGKK